MNDRTDDSAPGHLTRTFACQSPEDPSALRRSIARIVPWLFAMVVAAGCASTTVTNRQELVTGQLPRPDHIWVYDFAATAADVPADSALAGQYSEGATPQTAEQIATGRQLGAEIASQLVEQIRGMGLPAAQAGAGTTPQINDIVIRGYLMSIQEGNAEEREDGLRVVGQPDRPFTAATIDSAGDHRIAMAGAIAALAADGPSWIEDVDNVATSFPGFAKLLRSLGAQIE